jgi:ribosomal protein S18 acetylase RimI-like enzyme
VRLLPLRDRDAIEARLRRDPALHLYELGDLDDFFWPATTWYGTAGDGDGDVSEREVGAIALLYAASALPVLVAMARPADLHRLRALLELLVPVLPRRFFSHLGPGSADVLEGAFDLEPHGLHDRMVLVDRAKLDAVAVDRAAALLPADENEVMALYARAYPGNWFDPRMLATGAYFGVRETGKLVSVAGVHVVARRHRVAALGNITTEPALRGQGLGRIATAAVCRALADVDPIGLNVAADNAAAIAMYRSLGFERVACYEEVLATAKAGRS